MPLKTPGNHDIGNFDKNKQNIQEEILFQKYWNYSSAPDPLGKSEQRKVIIICDKSNAKGLSSVVK